ncbi:MAG TPA: GNAT family N-acetyltransferase [Bryobacteraceae bacterium]|nr:GNAT family N-acetyltransferase [Bryobacteraceae bacterium]
MLHAASDLVLRDLEERDLPVLFEQQRDPDANWMAAFVSRDPSDRVAYLTHWRRVLDDPAFTKKVIVRNGEVVGSIGSFLWEGKPQVMYWIGKQYWGQGIATRALAEFVRRLPTRPLYASAAGDNTASIRVLEKCGFAIRGSVRAFARARGREIEEVLLQLDA